MLHNTLSFLIALGALVIVHEWGHFIFARKLGVKVLRFSVGFGPVLFAWKDKQDCEYAVSLIPLGGYVKMLDESEGMVPDELLNQAFNRQKLWKRSLIVFAGPLINFVFATILLWATFIIGVPVLKPFLGEVTTSSIAEQSGLKSGDEVIAVDDVKVANWQEVGWEIAKHIGAGDRIKMEVIRESQATSYYLDLATWQVDESDPEVLNTLGITPGMPKIKPVVDTVLPDSAAAKAGVLPGDLIISVEAKPVRYWQDFVGSVKNSPGVGLKIGYTRNGQHIEEIITPTPHEVNGQIIGRIGVSVQMPEVYKHTEYDPISAIGVALKKTGDILSLSVVMLSKLFVGEISVKSLGGPIAIAKGAGESASYGIVAFFGFLAYLSVNLGLINLLPIPALDGGHLTFYAIEAVKGSPLSANAQGLLLRLGVTLILALMGFVIFNDLMKLY